MTPTKEITVQTRDVYGTEKVYPICDSAMQFASIAGTTTLTERVLKRIEALGYTITYLLRR